MIIPTFVTWPLLGACLVLANPLVVEQGLLRRDMGSVVRNLDRRAISIPSVTTAAGPLVTSTNGSGGVPSRYSSILPPDLLAKIWTDPSTIPSYGYDRPTNTTPALSFGFWPITWSTNVPEGQSPNGQSRPGGDLFWFGLTPNSVYLNGTSTYYYVYTDRESLDNLNVPLSVDCDATIGLGPEESQFGGNVTIQTYRDSSAAFGRVDKPTGPNEVNTTFEACVNQSLARNLLITNYKAADGAVGGLRGCVGWVVVVVGVSTLGWTVL